MSSTIEHSLFELIQAVGVFQKHPHYLEGCGLFTQTELKVIDAVKPNNKIKMSEISKILGTTKGGATQLVDRLVDKKILTRNYNKDDRRIVYIALTSDGVKAHKSYIECKSKIIGSVCKRLVSKNNDVEKKDCIKFMKTLTSILKGTPKDK
ncbi:MAG: MarR family transcriptional regulator [bacterium]